MDWLLINRETKGAVLPDSPIARGESWHTGGEPQEHRAGSAGPGNAPFPLPDPWQHLEGAGMGRGWGSSQLCSNTSELKSHPAPPGSAGFALFFNQQQECLTRLARCPGAAAALGATSLHTCSSSLTPAPHLLCFCFSKQCQTSIYSLL